jgi:hypothetical protein
MDSHVGSGKIITAPLITEDGRPIKDPLVLLEATSDKNTSEGAPATRRNEIEVDETAERITDKQIIEWKLTLHQIGMIKPFSFLSLYFLGLFSPCFLLTFENQYRA